MKSIVVVLSITLALTTLPQKQTSSVVGHINESKPVQATKIVEVVEATAEPQKAPEPAPTPVPTPAPAPSGSCADWIAQAGVTDPGNAYTLIMRESGCRPTARNASSGSYGIPQALPASKIAHCGNDPICQIQWMQSYVVARYGSWAGAVAHSNAKGWY